MNYVLRAKKIFVAMLSIQFLFIGAPAFSQSPSAKTVQLETDWEKIRDAQVQMIKKKEADLDRMKEELLARAQPQAQIQTGFPEIEAEMKKREAEWLQKSDRVENENTMLKVKIEEQKNEINSLRVKLDLILKQNPSFPVDAPSSNRPVVSDSAQNKDAEVQTRADQLNLKEKQLQTRQSEWEQQIKKETDSLTSLQAEKLSLEKERADWMAEQSKAEQKRKAELIQIETDQREIESQKNAIEKDKAQLIAEQKSLTEKAKSLEGVDKHAQELSRLGDDLTRLKKEMESKQIELTEREKRISESQKNLVEEKRLATIQKSNQGLALTQKLADLESKLKLAQDSKQLVMMDLKNLEAQAVSLKNQSRVDRDAIAELELKWKKRESDLLAKNAGAGEQAGLVQERLAEATKKLMNAEERLALSQNEKQSAEVALKDTKAQTAPLEIRLNDSIKKNALTEEKLKAAESRLQTKSEDFLLQGEIQKKAWTHKLSEAEKTITALMSSESLLKKKNSDLESRLFQVEEKLSQSQKKLTELLARNAEPVSSASDAQLRLKLEQIQDENIKWQGMKQEIERSWSAFVNKEMEYQMEIEELKKRNQALQNQMASAFSVPGDTPNQSVSSQRQQTLN